MRDLQQSYLRFEQTQHQHLQLYLQLVRLVGLNLSMQLRNCKQRDIRLRRRNVQLPCLQFNHLRSIRSFRLHLQLPEQSLQLVAQRGLCLQQRRHHSGNWQHSHLP
jgi:hypothetical protein